MTFEQLGLWVGDERAVSTADSGRVGGAGMEATAGWLREHPDVVARYREKVWRSSAVVSVFRKSLTCLVSSR